MKTIFTAALVLATTALSFANETPNFQFKIDWNKKATLSGDVVQQCDDTYYPAVEIVVPGTTKDFGIEMTVDIKSGKLDPGCTIKGVKSTSKSTTYILDATNGGCTVDVFNRKGMTSTNRQAHFEISDAC